MRVNEKRGLLSIVSALQILCLCGKFHDPWFSNCLTGRSRVMALKPSRCNGVRWEDRPQSPSFFVSSEKHNFNSLSATKLDNCQLFSKLDNGVEQQCLNYRNLDSIAVSVFADIFFELTNIVSDNKIQITILILRRGALSSLVESSEDTKMRVIPPLPSPSPFLRHTTSVPKTKVHVGSLNKFTHFHSICVTWEMAGLDEWLKTGVESGKWKF